MHIVSVRVKNAIQAEKNQKSIEYLGCDIEFFKKHMEDQFKDGMSWENHGEIWHIDHKIPLKFNKPTLEEVKERLHYTNCQPLLGVENMRKGNRYITL